VIGTKKGYAMATILVIDDEASIRHLLKETLVQAGHRVLEANDGKAGLASYQQHRPDLVIMDLLMPETDGLEATLQLSREYVDTKIIAITGAQGDRNFLDVARLFGACRAFEKPFDLKQIVQAVQEELATSHSR
jgi:two-component system response regulator (stage 0 sporulation protein F)